MRKGDFVLAAPQSDSPSADAGRVPGIVYVWAAVLLFAAANSVVQLLADLGARHPVEGRSRRKQAALSSTEGAVAAEGSVSFKGI